MQIVGGKFLNVMKIVPCLFDRSSEKLPQFFQFQNEQKLKCKQNMLSEVTIELRDSFGNLIQFFDDATTCIVLKFTENNKGN